VTRARHALAADAGRTRHRRAAGALPPPPRAQTGCYSPCAGQLNSKQASGDQSCTDIILPYNKKLDSKATRWNLRAGLYVAASVRAAWLGVKPTGAD
jgi:hypothetical protein